MRVLVVDVHRPASPTAGPPVLGEQLGHHAPGVDAAREGVSVLSVVAHLLVAVVDAVGHHSGNAFLYCIVVDIWVGVGGVGGGEGVKGVVDRRNF